MIELSRNDLEVGMVAHDVEAMLAFYRDVFGLAPQPPLPVPGTGTLHRFLLGSNTVKVLAPEQPVGATPGGLPWEAAGVRYWTVHVTDLDAALAPVRASRGSVLLDVQQPTPKIRYAIVADPDGNCIELVEGA